MLAFHFDARDLEINYTFIYGMKSIKLNNGNKKIVFENHELRLSSNFAKEIHIQQLNGFQEIPSLVYLSTPLDRDF